MKLSQGKEALLDAADYPLVCKYHWFAALSRNVFYATTHEPTKNGKRKTLKMHQLLLNLSYPMKVDHWNGNGCDNRRNNLRASTNRQNLQNMHIAKSSQYPGVYWRRQKWHAQIIAFGDHFHIGFFEEELDAHKAYVAACKSIESGTFPAHTERKARAAALRELCQHA